MFTLLTALKDKNIHDLKQKKVKELFTIDAFSDMTVSWGPGVTAKLSAESVQHKV